MDKNVRSAHIDYGTNQLSVVAEMKGKFEGFDESEVKNWLIALSSVRSEHFLCLLSEAVLKADDEDYSIIRPALMDLKRKYSVTRLELEGIGESPRDRFRLEGRGHENRQTPRSSQPVASREL